MAFLPKILNKNDAEKEQIAERRLIHFESQFGRNIFGPIPKGHNRDFFCLDENTWIWHEDWTDEDGKRQVLSTRYVIRPAGAIKSQNGSAYQQLEAEEADHLFRAIKKYATLAESKYNQILSAA
jgi:hypothetical protein